MKADELEGFTSIMACISVKALFAVLCRGWCNRTMRDLKHVQAQQQSAAVEFLQMAQVSIHTAMLNEIINPEYTLSRAGNTEEVQPSPVV